jgi:pSer/pThr/pTyr-binding forkhead associated (FHA) protein
MDGFFRISEPDKKQSIIRIHEVATIGRDADNDIVLNDQTVSRCHALVEARLGSVMLTDLDSTNGTLVNDTPVPADEPIRLRHGDRIKIGLSELCYEVPIQRKVSYLDRATPTQMWIDLGLGARSAAYAR